MNGWKIGNATGGMNRRELIMTKTRDGHLMVMMQVLECMTSR
jgi:hypothetical protein